MCELCDIVPDKDNKGRKMVKKCFVLHEKVIDAFYENFYIPAIENFYLFLSHVRIFGSMECGETRNDCFQDNASK